MTFGRLDASGYMIRPIKILITLLLFSCDPTEMKPDSHQHAETRLIDMLEPDHDTLPNGQRLLDNMDSALRMYYKEVVGSDTLKGGYITCYGIDDSTKYFYLRRGDTLHLLNQTSIYASTWGLGILEKDFNIFFMTQIDNGNGSPSSYQLFDKKTGRNLLGDKVEAVSYTYLKDTLFMLYVNWSEDRRADSFILFNAKTLKNEHYKLPNDIPYWQLYRENKNI